MTLEEVKDALNEVEKRFIRLYRRFQELSGQTDIKEDKRTLFNVDRNLKISANRAYGWAKKAGCSADEAYERAIIATFKSARDLYPASIVDGSLPNEVITYIDYLRTNYSKIKTAKSKRS